MRIAVVNAGSSSLKLTLLDEDGVERARTVADPQPPDLDKWLEPFIGQGSGVEAVGHRVVHGGSLFEAPVLVDSDVEGTLDRLVDLAPLHNPPAVAAIRAARRIRPDLAQVACFDTTFHSGLPSESFTYALPDEWRSRWGIRRFGFHGLSHAWASRRAAALLARSPAGLRLVTAHLGAGASLAAVRDGRSIDTTMGFTPLEGLVMATRSGSLDPGIVLWLERHAGMSPESLEHSLDRESGLLGLSGRSGDLREVLSAADSGDERSQLAYGVYLHRLRAEVAAMAASMSGLDALVFTGGAGENSPRLRRDTCAGLGFLGLWVDEAANEGGSGDRVVSGGGTASVLVVGAREDLEIAGEVRRLLGARS